MVADIFGPEWFYTISSLFELVTVIVTILISLQSLRFYKFSKERKYLYFSISFLSIAISFLAKIITTIATASNNLDSISRTITNISSGLISSTPYLESIGFLAHQEFMLLGLAGIYLINQRNRKISQAILLTYLVSVITFFSNAFHYMFYATSTVFLALITLHYIKNHLNKKTHTSRLITISFGIILISQLVFILVFLNPVLFYVTAEIIQLLGYITLLYSYSIITQK